MQIENPNKSRRLRSSLSFCSVFGYLFALRVSSAVVASSLWLSPSGFARCWRVVAFLAFALSKSCDCGSRDAVPLSSCSRSPLRRMQFSETIRVITLPGPSAVYQKFEIQRLPDRKRKPKNENRDLSATVRSVL